MTLRLRLFWRVALATLTVLLGGVAAVVAPAQTASAATVCRDTTGIVQHFAIHQDNNPKKTHLADLWYHSTTHGGCYVLQAVAWRGTSHVIGIRVCGGVPGTGPNYGGGCSAWDRASYKYYVGPVYWNANCANVYAYVKNPSSQLVYSGHGVFFACD